MKSKYGEKTLKNHKKIYTYSRKNCEKYSCKVVKNY